MRVLFIFCHPLSDSFHAAIRKDALEGLGSVGHDIDLLDLYGEDFDPVLTAEGRRLYHDQTRNQHGLESYVGRLRAAQALVVQFPTWCFGPPAMLKGFLDRLFMPGVAFDLSDPHRARPLLRNITKLAGIVTYGRPRSTAWYMGDPPRKLVTRYLRWFIAPRATVQYLALYHLNVAPDARRRAFVAKTRAAMSRF